MNLLQSRIRELIDDLVGLADSSSSQKELQDLVTREVKASGAGDREIALAFSTLVTGLQQHLKSAPGSDGFVVCSFCHKSQREVKTMIQGPTASICNECVAICEETISSKQGLLQRLFGSQT